MNGKNTINLPVTYVEQLRAANRLTAPLIETAIENLELEPGSTGLDAGCGIGIYTVLLSDAVGNSGTVIGIDRAGEHLHAAQEVAAELIERKLVRFERGDLYALQFADNSLDWLWCADTLWTRGRKGLHEFKRVVKPGGRIFLAYWDGQMLLPGYPGLEARLHRAHVKETFYHTEIAPEENYTRALGWMQDLGLAESTVKSYVRNFQAPFDNETMNSLAYIFDMFWGNLENKVAKKDWQLFRRLCDPDSEDFILNCEEYYGYIVYSVFSGTVDPG